MEIKMTLLRILGGVFITVFVFSQLCFSQSKIDNLPLNKKASVFIDNFSVESSLNYLSVKSNIPIGFVQPKDFEKRQKKISLKIIKGTVEYILNKIVEADNRYSWSFENGVINVYPKESQFRFEETKLDIFEINDIEIEEIHLIILNHPKVKSEIVKRNLKASLGVKYDGPLMENPVIKLSFHHKTIKDILNKLLIDKSVRFWAITYFGDKNEFIGIDLLGYNASIPTP